MPLLAPIIDLVVGLMLRLILLLIVLTAKLSARFVWGAVTEHPGLSFLGVLVARDQGWIDSQWTPLVLAAFGVLAVVRFFTLHRPTQVAQRVQQEASKAYKAGAAFAGTGRKARAWVGKVVRRRRTPQDDAAIPLGPVGGQA